MMIVQFRGHLVRQYRACFVDSLGLGITCLISLYYVYKASPLLFMPSLYSNSKNFYIYLSPLIFNSSSADHIGGSIQQCHKQQKILRCTCSLDYSRTYMYMHVHVYMYVEKCMSTRAHGIGGLLANTEHCILT